jgi:ketol-acid reductoisomerase
MNRVISDSRVWLLFDHACKALLAEYVKMHDKSVGRPFNNDSNGVDNKELIEVNGLIRNHPVGWSLVKESQ